MTKVTVWIDSPQSRIFPILNPIFDLLKMIAGWKKGVRAYSYMHW